MPAVAEPDDCALTPGFTLCSMVPLLCGIVPVLLDPGTIWGAGDSPGFPGVTFVAPAPTPEPLSTPEVFTPRAPTERLAPPAIVSLMLRPDRGR